MSVDPNFFGLVGFDFPVGSGSSPPATPVLSITNHADGTGVTAGVAGSTVGSANTVYYQAAGAAPTGSWTAGGSRTGDGTVVIGVAPGAYWFYVVSVLSGQQASSAVVYGQGTATVGNSPHNQILTAIGTIATAMGLQLDGRAVAIEQTKKLGVPAHLPGSPVLRIAPNGREQREIAFSGGDPGVAFWVKYPVVVGLIATGRLDIASLTNELGAYIDWRKDLASRVALPSNLGLPFVSGVEVQYNPVLDEQMIEKGSDVSAIGFMVETLE